MSGGTWNYQQFRLEEEAAAQLHARSRVFLEAIAETERLCDWAEACDMSRESAEHHLYDLWVATFDAVYGR